MEKTRILQTTSENYDSSIERDIGIIVRLLDKSRFEAAVACPLGAPADMFQTAGATTFRVDMPSKFDPRPIRRLSSVLKEYRPHLIHAHTARATLFSCLAARGTGVPVVQTEHIWTDSLAEAPTEHKPPKSTRLLHRLLARDMIWRVVVLSESSANFHLKLQGLDPAKVTTIRYAVEPPPSIDATVAAEKRKELGINPDTLLVTSFGRLDLVKGLTYLVSAIPKVVAANPKTVFCFLGHGKEGPNLERQAAELGVTENVIFAGWRNDVFEMMAASDIVVSPSLSENASRILMESMAVGKPLVVSDVGAQREYVGDGGAALVVPPMDPEALAQALIRLLGDPDLRSRMGEIGRERYHSQFRPERYVGDLQELYLEALADRGGPDSMPD